MSKTTKHAEAKAETAAEVKTEAVVEAEAKEPAKQEKKESLMYLGPTITGVIRNAEVYAGELPEAIKKCVEECPVMERLFVNLDGVADAVKSLRKETSALGAIYAQVAQKYSRR